VEQVEAFISPAPPHVPVITCYLEDDKQFNLYYVPLEIVIAINKLAGHEDYENSRESVFEILPFFKDIVRTLSEYIVNVKIDALDNETLLYSATLELKLDSIRIKRRMIPSHAIYLALLTNKPLYVKKELVERQDEMLDEEG